MTGRERAIPRADGGSEAAPLAPMVSLAIVASFVVYAPDVLAGIEPPKTFVAGLILGTAILQAIVTGAWREAVKSLHATWSSGDPWRRAGLASLVAFLAVVGASTAASIVPRSSLLGTLNRGQGTLFVATMVVAIAASWPSLRAPSGARSIVRAVAAGGFVPAVVAIVQSVGYDLAQGGPVTTDRAAGTLGNPVNLGTMMAMSAVAAMALAYEAAGLHHVQLRRPRLTPRRDQQSEGGDGTDGTGLRSGGNPPDPQGSPTIILGAIGVVVAIGTRLTGIAWPSAAWVVVPASVVASALIAWSGDGSGQDASRARRGASRVRLFLWMVVAIACIAAIGASRSRGPAVALGVGVAAWVILAVMPRKVGPVRRIGVGVGVAAVVAVLAFVAGSALPATVRAIQALPPGAIGGGGAMAEVQAQADAVGRETIGTREIAWRASLDAFRNGSRTLDPRWVGTAMASSGHQIVDLDAIADLPDHRVASSLLRRAIGYGPESQVALIGADAAGQPFDRAHAAPLDILLAHGAIGLAAVTVLAIATVVVSARSGRHDGATAADQVVIPVLVASAVASLTGVDGTAQVVATWSLVAVALARRTDTTGDNAPARVPDPVTGDRDRTAVLGSRDGARSTTRTVAAGALIAGVGVALAMAIGDGATDPRTWAVAVASSITGAYVIGRGDELFAERAGVTVVRVAIAPAILATIVMVPAWGALAAGAEARAATASGRSVDERQAGLSRATTLDPGVVTYRQLRGI